MDILNPKGIMIMSSTINSSGKYTVKETGDSESYEYSYSSFESMDDAIGELGEATCLKLIQRMVKVDANNTSREKAKVANGHSTRAVMSEEEKATKKAERAENKALLEALRNDPEALEKIQAQL